MRRMLPGSHDALIDAILAHLADHPLAADSADGVARWWLAGNVPAASAESVEQALSVMVARGQLRRVELPDGTVIYGRDGVQRR
jgi:hypothetical protein